jgi:hypothetical protein
VSAEFSLVLAAPAVQAGLPPTVSALAVGYDPVMSVLGTTLMGRSARSGCSLGGFGPGESLPAGRERIPP